jgi:hypothetical protein
MISVSQKGLMHQMAGIRTIIGGRADEINTLSRRASIRKSTEGSPGAEFVIRLKRDGGDAGIATVIKYSQKSN